MNIKQKNKKVERDGLAWLGKAYNNIILNFQHDFCYIEYETSIKYGNVS